MSLLLKYYFLYNKSINSPEVNEFLKENDLTLRVIEENGIVYAVTDDLKLNRLDIRIKDNIIISVL